MPTWQNATPEQRRKTILLEARREARDMDDSQLGTYLTWLRRLLTMADEDGLPEWLVLWCGWRLEAAEQEWDWRKRAEHRGGPRLARENYRDKLDRLRERHDIVTVASMYTQVVRAGREWKGLCPFHREQSPSFYVNPEKGTWHCFGCGMGGDVFTLIEAKETGDFVEAVRWLERHAVPGWARVGA